MKRTEKEAVKQKLIQKWLKYIGMIPRPYCHPCSLFRTKPKKTENLRVDFDHDRDEFLIIIECSHGKDKVDQDITRIPMKKAYEIAKIEFFAAFVPNTEKEKVLH